jgi:serine/threonine protein kinase
LDLSARAPEDRPSGLLSSELPPIGEKVGAYRLISVIGRGGTGSVYLAERADGELLHRAAVKLYNANRCLPAWQERLVLERQLLASLQHPSIVHAIDAGHTAEGRPFLVMEYVDGVPIDVYAAGVDVRSTLRLFLEVCEGISHAHRRLIIHRDLKPSNILVDASGKPKVLDFGIARLMDETREASVTTDRMHTPGYASPEQLRGEAQTTATDVYSLGAVLYKLLTGVELRRNAAASSSDRIAPPSSLNRNVPRDLDFIVNQALRVEPEERYVSVDQFAQDIRAVLDGRAVRARSGDAWYRTRRFLRCYWAPVAAASIALTSLSSGLYVANRQREIAEKRVVQVRQLANRLFDIEYEVRKLPGNTEVRQLIVDTSLDYLQRLTAGIRVDPELALDVGNAYLRVARVQGVPNVSNLGQMDQAERNLRAADGFVQSVLASQPANKTALLRAAQIAHDRMLLARYDARYQEAQDWARKSATWLEKFPVERMEKFEAAAVLNTYANVADQLARGRQLDEALRITQRATDLARASRREDYLPDLLWVSADVRRARGDLDQALKDLDDSVRLSDPGPGDAPLWLSMNFALSLICRGDLLGEIDAISLGRSAEAVGDYDHAFQLADALVHRDAHDQMLRSRVANAGIAMADILRVSNPIRALAIYDHVFRHVAQVPNNSSFRRFEVSTLAGSTYALRQLGLPVEARKRLDAAFERLEQVHLFPAKSVRLRSEPEVALRARAAYEAAAGDFRRAAATYQNLLALIRASHPDPENTLADAARISVIYWEAAAAARQAGDHRASEMEALRRQLWELWNRKLPNNAFVRSHLGAVGRSAATP